MCSVDKKVLIAIDDYDDLLIIKMFGKEMNYHPLYTEGILNWLVGKLSTDIKIGKVEVWSHISLNCLYSLPEIAWASCNFYEEYKKHCINIINNEDKPNLVRRSSWQHNKFPALSSKSSKYKDDIQSAPTSCNNSPRIKQCYNLYVDVSSVFTGEFTIKNNIIECSKFDILSECYFKVNNNTVHLTELTDFNRKYLYKQLSIAYRTVITDSADFNIDNFNIKPNGKIFLIPSILNVPNSGGNKNIYSQEERFKQTLDQVKSIFNKYMSSYVFILELSHMSLRQMQALSPYCTSIIFFNKDSKALAYASDTNKNKAEVYLQLFMMRQFRSVEYSHICKFGGRYSLTTNFNPMLFFTENPCFKYIEQSYDGTPIYESILYSIPRKYHTLFEEILKVMERTLEVQFTDVEHLLYKCFKDFNIKTVHIPTLGIKGVFAGSGIYNCS